MDNGRQASHQLTVDLMPYACQTCVKRKIKCDKIVPTCGACVKSQLSCHYHAPPPRAKKRRLDESIHDRLALYEGILSQHGLLPQDSSYNYDRPTAAAPGNETTANTPTLRFHRSEISRTGRILASHGKSRYVDNSIWGDMGETEMMHLAAEVDDEQDAQDEHHDEVADPFTASFLGIRRNLLIHHPSHQDAMSLWKIHVERVEPICRVLHIQTIDRMVQKVSQEPYIATKSEEALLFAIYGFAVFAMTDDECVRLLRQPKRELTSVYRFAVRQALANATFLKTTETMVLQAYTLHLLATRFVYDPHTYWILTGICVRIAQRLGLHRDGGEMGLDPFEVQMRRRIWFQVIPLEGIASRLSGTGISLSPESWTTQSPLNLNDSQIWPGMTQMPQEDAGATDMIFCLTRATIGMMVARSGVASDAPDMRRQVEDLIRKTESTVEERFIRYCDIANPVHFLTMGFARCAITAFRMHVRMPRVRDKTATLDDRRDILQLAKKILELDITVHAQPNIKKFQWLTQSFHGWGSWDSLVFVLGTLQKGDLLNPLESDEAWQQVITIYNNHNELTSTRRTLHIAVARLTLKAWEANPPHDSNRFADLWQKLRSFSEIQTPSHSPANAQIEISSTIDLPLSVTPTVPETSTMPSSVESSSLVVGDVNVKTPGREFSFDVSDWLYWEKMIKDYEASSN